jgi:crotonobetainyl-CoA:carnitine CoA-transferase CaiB-like acyl-CoA transferase
MKAYDMLVQAESGLSALSGKEGWPTRIGASVADISCGMFAHSAICEALFHAQRTGEGCAVDVSLFSSLADWMTVPLFHFEADGKGPAIGHGLRHPSVQPYAAYKTTGDPILISIQNEREFKDFCEKALRRPGLPEDPRFCSNVARCEHSQELDEVIQAWFLSMDRSEIVATLRKARIAYGEVNSVQGFAKHPALTRVPVGIPGGETVQAIAPPAKINGRPRKLRPVPAYGEHTEAIRKEFS